MSLLEGEHVSSDVTLIDGESTWLRHSTGIPLEDSMFDYWIV